MRGIDIHVLLEPLLLSLLLSSMIMIMSSEGWCLFCAESDESVDADSDNDDLDSESDDLEAGMSKTIDSRD